MRKLFASEWVSLDGVFDAGNMDQWFNPYHSDERMAYIQQMILGSDAILFGRTTYEMLAPYWSTLKNNEMGVADQLNNVAKYVVSSTLKTADWHNTTIIKDNVADAISKLKQQPGQDMHIEGSPALVQSLMPTGLIDEYRFLVHPAIAGNGKRFFKDGMDATKLELVKTKTFSLGVVLLCYQPAK